MSKPLRRTWPPLPDPGYPLGCLCHTCRLLRLWRAGRLRRAVSPAP